MEEAELRQSPPVQVGGVLAPCAAGSAIWLAWRGPRGAVATLIVSEGRAGRGLGSCRVGSWWGQEQVQRVRGGMAGCSQSSQRPSGGCFQTAPVWSLLSVSHTPHCTSVAPTGPMQC